MANSLSSGHGSPRGDRSASCSSYCSLGTRWRESRTGCPAFLSKFIVIEVRKLNQKQYAAFAADVKTLDKLRRNEARYVPGVFEVTKVIVLGKEDFEKLSEDVSPEYPFLKDNRELMSADPGGLFRCLMVSTKGEQEYMLIAQGRNSLYLGYGKDCRKVNLQDVPMEHLVLEEPKAYQEHAVFYHRPHDLSDINGQNPRHPAPERQTEFRVEQVVILADEEYRQFQEIGFCKTRFSCLITKTRCGSIPAASVGTVYW